MPAALLEPETEAGEAVTQIEALVNAPWFPRIIDPRFFEYIKSEGRVARLGDARAAHSYRGWMLFQVWLLSGTRGIHSRWIYYFETLAAGRILDRPIPPLSFSTPPQTKDGTLSHLRKLVEKLGREHGYGERALNTLIEWVAFGLGVCDARPDVSEKTARWLYEQLDITAFLTWPYDYMGHLLEEERGNSKRFQGFFLTHDHVCELMAALALEDFEGDIRRARVHEPAVGSARQLLHASNHSLALTAADIDPVCVVVTLINSACHCPWLAFPFPAHILESTTAATEAVEPVPHRPDAHDELPAVETPRGAQTSVGRQTTLFDF